MRRVLCIALAGGAVISTVVIGSPECQGGCSVDGPGAPGPSASGSAVSSELVAARNSAREEEGRVWGGAPSEDVNTEELFNEKVLNPDRSVVFVKFYKPTCPNCEVAKPEWDRLADRFNTNGSDVLIAQVNCAKQEYSTNLCYKYGIAKLPMVKSFGNRVQGETGKKYLGPFEYKSLRNAIKTLLKDPCEIKTRKACDEDDLEYLESLSDTPRSTMIHDYNAMVRALKAAENKTDELERRFEEENQASQALGEVHGELKKKAFEVFKASAHKIQMLQKKLGLPVSDEM